MSDEQERRFVDGVRRRLDESVDDLPASVRQGLIRARRAALAELDAPSLWARGLRAAVPAVGVAAAASLVAWLYFGQSSFAPVQMAGQEDLLSDMELLAQSEDMELYENLEFYQWLAAQEDLAM